MNIRIKALRDELDINYFAFFNEGEFTKPLMIIDDWRATLLMVEMFKKLPDKFQKEFNRQTSL